MNTRLDEKFGLLFNHTQSNFGSGSEIWLYACLFFLMQPSNKAKFGHAKLKLFYIQTCLQSLPFNIYLSIYPPEPFP